MSHGGLFPAGFGVALMTLQAVVFAYSAIELVGIAAGETKDPEKIMPRAINGVVYRIAIFYVGSVLLLTMLLPWHHFTGTESPFVTVFSALGITPFNIVERLELLIRNIADLGIDTFRWAFNYFLLGAIVVVPIWFVVRLMKRDSKP